MHVIVIWLKHPNDAGACQRLINASQTFLQIPSVCEVRAGTMIPSTRPGVDSSFDVAVVMTFTNAAALRNFATNPLHQKEIRDTLKPLAQKFRVYDFSLPRE